MGDPAGIGPEVVVKAAQSGPVRDLCALLILGDHALLRRCAEGLGLAFSPSVLPVGGVPDPKDDVTVLDFGNASPDDVPYGQATAEGGRACIDYIEGAVGLALRGAVDAVATGPINKEAILRAGCPFPGHTEMIARLTNCKRFVMMLAGGPLRVAFVTTHVALRKIFSAISVDSIVDTIRVVSEAFPQFFGTERPKLGVCGLNPHASDGGRFGNEEEKVIVPAIARATAKGFECEGPVPPDIIFHKAARGDYDAVIAMYHDQGHIPLKLIAFDTGVNLTLGLPIIRTSVDHGTAYDIVGQGLASPNSMIEAVKIACNARPPTPKRGRRSR